MDRFYERAACGLLTTDSDGVIIAANETVLAWIGARSADVVGRRTFAELLTGGGRIYHETHYLPLLVMQGFAREIAFDLVCPGGVRLPVLVNARIDVDGADRVIHVAVFDATERRSYERELLVAKERAERSESEAKVLARTLQNTLLPRRLPAVPGLEIAARYLPAGAGHEIGGDFYDVFQVGTDDWVIALGDVEGKGVDAALVTALVRYTIRAGAIEHEPSDVLRLVNEVLLHDDTPRYCTATILRCRRAGPAWRITISCGGHPLPVLSTARRGRFVGRPGTLLGVYEQVDFHDVDIELDDNTVLLAYTDGVTEARRGREFFGADRIIDIVDRHRQQPVSEILTVLVEAALAFGGNPNQDDIAAIAVKPEAPSVANPFGL